MPAEATFQLSELADGTMKSVVVDGEEVVVAKVEGRCFAFGGTCTHDGGPMIDGELDGTTVTCPWHFSEFDVGTGAVIDGLADEALPVYEVRVEGDEVHVLKS